VEAADEVGLAQTLKPPVPPAWAGTSAFCAKDKPEMAPTLLITGASRGIGAATALQAAAAGWQVAVNYRQDAAGCAQVVADIRSAGGVAQAFQADVAEEAQIIRCLPLS
jgi:NADP-dependent 3-hydroxy acid dehydrogenase YdfG